MDLQQFRKLADAALSTTYGAEPAEGDEDYANIRGAFSTGLFDAALTCHELRTDLIREHVVLDASLDPYYKILSILCDALRAPAGDLAAAEGDWSLAVLAACRASRDARWNPDPQQHHRELAVARAARRLKDQGYAIRLAPGWISLEDCAETALLAEVERLAAGIGGLNLARSLFAALAPSYDATMQRYHLIPGVSARPLFPWGYLLQLAVKHFLHPPNERNTQENWERLLEQITDYTAVIDVQPYVLGEALLLIPEQLLKHLQDLALYDTLFRFPQLRPSDAARLCQGLLGFLDPTLTTPDGWCIAHAVDVVDALFTLTPDVRGPVTVSCDALCRALPHVPPDEVRLLLEQVLSHPAGGANQEFSNPTSALGTDFHSRPLLHIANGRFLMIDRSVCAAACIEALLAPLRLHVKGLDDKAGKQAERFLEAEFSAHGVTPHHGEYKMIDSANNAASDCDLVIETTEKIVFLELKKKALTRKARVANAEALLIDLAQSLVHAQEQAGKHEQRLRLHDHIALEHEGQTYQLFKKSRSIERLAITLFDYGGFQDRALIVQLMEILPHLVFSRNSQTPEDMELDKKLKALNQKLDKLRQQLEELPTGPLHPAPRLEHCWFLSVPQLLVLLDEVTDAESFWTALKQTRSYTTGVRDFYYNLASMRGIRSAAAELQ
ncbi:hypothetical protein EGI20_12245 [Aquitalea sp. S1-19]|nr:hypothetical protein [Aquitalea sp. S1-19]